ncbi:MAG: transcription/translation regulatory transformer protein RfaH [Gallionellaceae bacterium]|nr:transcription/translation regulatory transformer protein RfaH [Gallionellaceae bacterium]
MEMVLLTTAQLAKRLGIAAITLQIWRSQGIGIPYVKQGTRVFYRLSDVQDYERRNVDSLSAWLLGSDRPLPEMEALVRAANLPLQKIRQRIANPPEIDGDTVSPIPQQHPQPADSAKSPEPEPTEPSADSDWQPQARPEHSSHRSPINAGQPSAHRPNGTLGASLATPRPFAPKAPELITTQQAAARLGLTTNALHELRCRDDGLQIFQKGFTVGYLLGDIQAFEQREASAMLDKVLSAGQPLPMLRAMATAMLSPLVTDSTTSLPFPIALPAPAQTIDAPSNIHRLPPVGVETMPTVPLLKDCSIVESTPLATPVPPTEQATPPGTASPPEPATPQQMPRQLIAPAFSSQTSAPNTLSWYLIHTKPRQEALALTNLSRQGFECYMPMLRLQKIRQRKTAMVAEPMFPRYLFIRLDTSGSGQSWSPIRSTLGVNQLVRFGGQPAKVDGQLIDLIRSREQGTQAQPLFSAGDNVTVADGPFAGLEAIYQNTDAESRSMILLNILSKPVAMRIDSASLRKTG